MRAVEQDCSLMREIDENVIAAVTCVRIFIALGCMKCNASNVTY